jgi:indolepyruvate decarboxylase
MAETVIQHVLSRLKEIGVNDVFGVAGDYAFPVNDAIVEHPGINWIGCCNELNASYAADGYARMRGVGAVCTTYGVPSRQPTTTVDNQRRSCHIRRCVTGQE